MIMIVYEVMNHSCIHNVLCIQKIAMKEERIVEYIIFYVTFYLKGINQGPKKESCKYPFHI